MKNKLLGLAVGVSLLFGLQQLAVAGPITAPASPAEMSIAQAGGAEQIYYAYRRGGAVRGPNGHACAGGRRCVGGYHGGVCRSWAACR